MTRPGNALYTVTQRRGRGTDAHTGTKPNHRIQRTCVTDPNEMFHRHSHRSNDFEATSHAKEDKPMDLHNENESHTIMASNWLSPILYSSEKHSQTRTSDSRSNSSTTTDDSFLQASIPTFSTGLTTFGYQLVLGNRIHDSKLAKDGPYDTKTYKPTFVHDCLMLPGSLASVLGKLSSAEIIPRMTPALLPGFRVDIHPTTIQPCLLQSSNQSEYVQGIVIFGQGRRGRDLIHQHYRPYSRRVKANVEIDVVVTVDSDSSGGRYRLERRKVSSNIWLWSDVACADFPGRAGMGMWRLEQYLDGFLTEEVCRDQDNGHSDDVQDGSDDDNSCVSAHGYHYHYITDGQTPAPSSHGDTYYNLSDSGS